MQDTFMYAVVRFWYAAVFFWYTSYKSRDQCLPTHPRWRKFLGICHIGSALSEFFAVFVVVLALKGERR